MALDRLYRDSLSLLTDLYQLTMAYGYWKAGMAEREAVFHLVFRTHPFGGAYAVACGLPEAMEFLRRFRFEAEDLEYLAGLVGNNEEPLFEPRFLDYLAGLKFACDVDAIVEGTPVFAHEPLVRVRGPVLQAQLLETPLLTLINFPTLLATKASRVCRAAQGEPVLEFGLRRAQGPDGGMTAARASYVGGCTGTSNVLAGKLYGIPVKGTHAHSWVMCFDSELESFHTYADALPNNCIFLVDTYDTRQGVRHAIEAGRRLRAEGHEMVGIRLDSGNLAELSIAARRLLDEAGFPDAAILASGDLDEYQIARLKQQGAPIGLWGVGTRLTTAYDQPALGGIYKLSAIRDEHGRWRDRVKLSEQTIKVSSPGIQQVRRFYDDRGLVADAIYDERYRPAGDFEIVHYKTGKRWSVPASTPYEELLVPIFQGGEAVYEPPPLDQTRAFCLEQLARVPEGVLQFSDPEPYQVGLEARLNEVKQNLIAEARSQP